MTKKLIVLIYVILSFAATAQKKDKMYYHKMQMPGVKMVSVFGKYKVWTQKIGNGSIKLLMLHGGPAGPHEYLEDLADSLAHHGIEVYLYEQLGSYYSDQPKADSSDVLWNMSNRIDEVEQVRMALGLDTFYLYGQSWGAALGLGYVHRFPGRVKGFIFSNMNMNYSQISPRINSRKREIDSLLIVDKKYKALASKVDWPGPKARKLFYHYYLVRTDGKVPESLLRTAAHHNDELNDILFNNMVKHGDYLSKLVDIKTPVLLLGSDHDFTVDESDLNRFAKMLPNARVRICKNSGHMSMFDSAEYQPYLLEFLLTEEGR